MARLFTSGFEVASNTDGEEWANVVAPGARSTTTFRSGAASGQVTGFTSTAQCGYGVQFVSALSNGPYFLRFYFRVDTLPSAANTICAFIAGANPTSTSVNDGQLRLAADGTLGLFANNAQVGSSSAALSTATWYLIEIHYDNSPASGSKVIRAYLDGTEFAGTSTSTNVGGTTNGIALGANLGAEAQTTGNWFFDDVAVNDNTGSFQTGLPGSGKVIAIWPNAAGDSNQWLDTAGSAGTSSNYTLVDETNPNDGTDFVQSSTLNDLDLYNFAASGLAAGDTVNVVHVHLRRRNATADATTAVNVVVVKTSGGTQANGTAVVPNNVNWRTGSVNSSTVILPNYTGYQDPDSAAWTSSTLDTMQAGPKLTAFGTNGIQVSTVWATVDYVPGIPAESSAATGTAETPTTSVAPSAEHAAATATAHDATVTTSTSGTDAAAECATATATAETPAASVAPSAESADGTGAAETPSVSLSSSAEHASATATAETPAASVAPSSEVATGNAAADDGTTTVQASAEVAIASVATETPSASVAASAESSTATAAAGDVTASVQAPAEAATATATAETPSVAVAGSAEPAVATATADDATVQTGTFTNASAECATATATAQDPSVAVGAGAESAGAVATAEDAAGTVAPSVEHAAATVAAETPTAAVYAAAECAEATAASADPSAAVAVLAEAAAIVAAAYDATVGGEVRATSTPTVTAGRTSTQTVTAGRTSAPTITAAATSAPTVGG